MSGREASKMKLSKSILEMKFMKKTKEKVEKQIYQEQGEEYFGSQLTAQMKNESGRFIVEPSYRFCEQLRDGRVSYQGMNPEIERIMELEQNAKLAKMKPKCEADVSDEQMAKRWKSSNVTTMGNKFKSRRERTQQNHKEKDSEEEPMDKRPKFMKPKD